MSTRYKLFELDELEPGQMRAVEVDGASIVVVHTRSGEVRALADFCPHMHAKLSHGYLLENVVSPSVGSYALDDQEFVIRCPWHAYEFSVHSGNCIADPRRARVRVYPTTVEDGTVYVER